MSTFFVQAGSLIIHTVFGLFILTVLLRFLLQLVRADFYNPFAQFIVRFSNPLLLPLRRVIPGLGGIDLAAVVLLLALEWLKLFLLAALAGSSPPIPFLLLAGVIDLLELTVWVFIIAVFIRVIASWFNPYGDNPLMEAVTQLTEPLMRPARRMIPTFSGIDLSPIAVLLLLQIVLLLLANIGPALAGSLN